VPVGDRADDQRTRALRESPLAVRIDHGFCESDGGDVALADLPERHREAQLAVAQPALVGMREGAWIAERRSLHGVLRGEARAEQELGVAAHVCADIDPRPDRSRVAAEQVLVIAVAVAEVLEDLRHERRLALHGDAVHAGDDVGGTGVRCGEPLAGKEQARDHPPGICVES
jgi:hypothetical protein